jgi:photosystem II stability/assembly factor-like uncharacterized protein
MPTPVSPRALGVGLLLFVVLAVAPRLARGLETPSLAEVLADDATLHDIEFLDADRGWAVGDRGAILRTEDGGATWRRVPSGVTASLHAVSFVDRNRGWAVGGETRPYTHVSSAVVLRTDDGGETWERVTHGPLPKLTAAQFFDNQHGVAAGIGSALAPGGAFETRDGGRSWRALPAGQTCAWSAGDFVRDPSGDVFGLVVGGRGAAGRLARNEVSPAASAGDSRGYHGVRWIDATRAWLVGDGGLVRATRDGGRTWTSPPTDPLAQEPADVFAAIGDWFDWRAVATRGAGVWIVGSPGSAVLTSHDGGTSWSLRATGTTMPLNAVEFLDERRGWAVGEMGSILVTRDGGLTWVAQRGGDRRSGVTIATATPEGLPAELLATNAVAEGRRASVFAPLAPASASQHADTQGRLREAAIALGAEALDVDWRLVVESGDERLGAERLRELLDRRLDGDASEWLAHRVRRHLLTYRPGALLATASCDAVPEGPAQLLARGVLDGVRLAGDEPPAWTGLRAWRPTATLSAWPLDTDQRADVLPGEARFATGGFSALLGGSPAQWSRFARGLLAQRHVPSPAAYAWRSMDEKPLSIGRHGDLLAGADTSRPNPSRRASAAPQVEQLDALRRIAQKQRRVEQLLASTAGDPAWAAQVMDLTGGLDAEGGAGLLLQLAEGYQKAGRPALAADTLYLLARRYPSTPSADAALVSLVRYYASGEWAHAASRDEAVRSRRSDAVSNVASNATNVVADDALNAPTPLGLEERASRAVRLAEHLEQTRPELYAEPGLRMAVAASQRARGYTKDSDRLLLVLGKQSIAGDWKRAALVERWLAEPTGLPPGKPLASCRPTARRPLLDGKLDDAAWRTAEPLTLVAAGESAGPNEPTVMLAHDDDFLYLAAAVPDGAAPPRSSAPRTRDEALDTSDRLVVRIDIDRDYATAYELTVDSRGKTHDAIDGDAHWNPKWFVASSPIEGAPNGWAIEAAVPLAELAPAASLDRAAWAVSLRRLRPGERPATWGGGQADSAAADPASPDSWGVVVWQ